MPGSQYCYTFQLLVSIKDMPTNCPGRWGETPQAHGNAHTTMIGQLSSHRCAGKAALTTSACSMRGEQLHTGRTRS
jgi:hypothetical protein